MSDPEGRSSPEDLPEDSDAAFIDALLGPRPEPREMTPEQSERLDRRFHAMVAEQRRAWARRRWAIAGAVVTVAAVGVGVGLAMGTRSQADQERAPTLMKARARPGASGSTAPRDSELVNGVGAPRR